MNRASVPLPECHAAGLNGGPDARTCSRRLVQTEESASWEAVRDSWVDGPPRVHPPRSEPPPLPASVRELTARRSPADAALADRMLERLAVGDYQGSLMAAEALLRRLPRDADALDCAEMSRKELRDLYIARLGGSLQSVPRLTTRDRLAALTLDTFTAFIVSRIDGQTTLDGIAFAPGLSPVYALSVLSELYLKDVIALDG